MAIIKKPAAYQGRVGNQFVGRKMWDPRGFWTVPDYGKPGQTLHIRPDGTKALVKTGSGGGAAAALGASGAAAPGAAPSPYNYSNLPPDDTYTSEVDAARLRRDNTFTDIEAERGRGFTEYGFTSVVDPKTGATAPGAYDPTNPFSKASILKKNYDLDRRAKGQSMAAAGNLYSGAYQNAQDLVNRGELQGNDALLKSLGGFLARNTLEKKDAGTAYETAAGDAYGRRVARFDTNPLYNPPGATPDEVTAAVKAGVASAPGATGPTKATVSVNAPKKTVNGRVFYQRASDKKWIPL